MLYKNILDAVGNTPMIELNHLTDKEDAKVYVKYEGMNVGGSIKTRTALRMIEAAEQEGKLHPDSTIVEPTSGNQGIGLALVAAVKGYRAILIMPDSVSKERRKLVRQYGAEVILVHDHNNIGECIDRCIQMAHTMANEDPCVYMPNQFENEANTEAHYLYTGKEILHDVPHIDGFCSGIGTGGTLTGVGHVLKEANPDVQIWAIEPENAALLSGKEVNTHLQMGIGDGVIPPILDRKLINRIELVTDDQALKTAKLLAAKEGLLAGISSGSNVCAALRMAKKLGKEKTVVTVLPDTGERYFSTPLFDE